MRYSRNSPTPDFSTHTEYQAIVPRVYGLCGVQRLRMILYADDIALLCTNVDELAEIVKIYDHTFTRFGFKNINWKNRNHGI